MNFSNDKAIYVQIAERLSDEILAGKYKEDERIPRRFSEPRYIRFQTAFCVLLRIKTKPVAIIPYNHSPLAPHQL